MDLTWITEQISLGGGIWTEAKMMEVVKAGVTHIIDMQVEFDDRPLAKPYGVQVLWNPVDDDFEPKAATVFERGVEFATKALRSPGAKVFIHCAAGVHRAPMMTLALLRVMGWTLEDAMETIQSLRPIVDFAEVYVQSVEEYVEGKRQKV